MGGKINIHLLSTCPPHHNSSVWQIYKMKLFQEIHCFIFRVALWPLMAANMNGGRKKKKDKETERQTFVLAGDVWLAAAESGLDVRQAVNWQKQGRRFSPPPASTAAALIYCGVP